MEPWPLLFTVCEVQVRAQVLGLLWRSPRVFLSRFEHRSSSAFSVARERAKEEEAIGLGLGQLFMGCCCGRSPLLFICYCSERCYLPFLSRESLQLDSRKRLTCL